MTTISSRTLRAQPPRAAAAAAPEPRATRTAKRWSASSESAPQWWRVDLEGVHDVSRVEIDWEFARQYGYDIEVSDDGVRYVSAYSHSFGADSSQRHSVELTARGRYVRIMIHRLTSFPVTWASFWEVRVFGR